MIRFEFPETSKISGVTSLIKVVKTKSKFAADNKIERLVQGLRFDKLNLSDLSEIEVESKSYYQIKE